MTDIKVGNIYKWNYPIDPNSVTRLPFVIIKIENNIVYYKYGNHKQITRSIDSFKTMMRCVIQIYPKSK